MSIDAATLYALSGLPPTDLASPDERVRVWTALYEVRREEKAAARTRASLEELHATFRAWLGQTYDVGILDAALGCRLAHLCLKDRAPWLLIVGGSAAAKTETLRSIEKSTGCAVVGTIISQATLLSGIGKKDQDKEATGGLLRELPPDSFWLLFDVTSILAQGQDARAGILDGFRWMYDGRWPRSTGGGGGQTAHWEGRIGVVGAVTTEIDRAHDANQKLGSRWLLIRQNESEERREDAGRHAVRKAARGQDAQMSHELDAAVARHIACIDQVKVDTTLTEEEEERIRRLGDLATRVRSVVNYDRSGWRVIDRHALEDPTRFPIALVLLFQGLLLLGLRRSEAMRLVARIARESVPPLRCRVLEDVATHGNVTVKEVRLRLGAADEFGARRELGALVELGALTVNADTQPHRYSLAKGRRVEWLEESS